MKFLQASIILIFALMSSAFGQVYDADSFLFGKKGSGEDVYWYLRDGGYLKKAFNGDWLFSKDGISEKKMGSGSGSGSGAINTLENDGFEDGVTAGITATVGTVTEAAGSAALEGEKSLVFTPVAQNNFWEYDLDAIGPALYGNGCEARIFYVGGTGDTMTASVIDGNDNVLGSILLPAHQVASFESIFFYCPFKDDVLVDADLGNLKLRVENTSASISAPATFDRMHLGGLIGLVETVLPDTLTATVSSGGVVSDFNTATAWISCTATSPYTCTYSSGLVDNKMNCMAIAAQNSNNFVKTYTSTSTGLIVHTTTVASSPASTDSIFEITCFKTGSDARQTAQVFMSVPRTAQNSNDFSAKMSDTGVISDENIDFINGNCTKGTDGKFNCPFISGTFTSIIPNCWAIARGRDSRIITLNPDTTLTNLQTTASDVGVNEDNSINIFCQRAGEDFKLPTVQPIYTGDTRRVPNVKKPKTCKYLFGGAGSTLAVPVMCTSGACEEVYDNCGTGTAPSWSSTGAYVDLTFADGTWSGNSVLDCKCQAFTTTTNQSQSCNPYFLTGDNTWSTNANGGAVLNVNNAYHDGTTSNAYVMLTCEAPGP